MAEAMDLKSMKRKDLQDLCKQHGIPANSTNSAMIESIESLFLTQQVVKRKGCLKGSGGSSGEGLGIGGSKKVTFVLEEEDEEVGDLGFGGNSGGKSSRRRSTVRVGSGSGGAKRVPGAPARSTRSRGLEERVLWSPVVKKKKVNKRARISGESSEESEDLDNVKQQVRSLRSRVVVVGGVEGSTEEFERVAKTEGRGKRSRDANVEEVGQKKLKKQAKDGKVVTEIIRRSTRSSSDGKVAEKEKPPKRRKASETATDPLRRATRRSSNLLEEPSDDEKDKTHEPAKQAMTRASEVVTEPVRRLTRSSANLKEDEVIVPAAGKFGNDGEAVRKGKSRKQTKKHVPEQGDLAVFISDSEAVVAPAKRSTRSSSKLLGDENAPLAAGKQQKQARKHVSRREDSVVSVSDSEAVTRSVKRLTRSSSIFLKDEGSAVAVVKPQQQPKKHVSGRGGSTVSLSDSEAVISPMRRSTRGSSKLLEGASSLMAVGKIYDDFGAVRKEKSGKLPKKGSASKASLLASEAINKPTRRSHTFSMHKLLEDGTSSQQHEKSEVESSIMGKGKSSKQANNRASNRGASTAIVPHSEALGRATRRSAHNFSLHNLADKRSSRLKLRKSVVDNKAVRKKKRVEQRNVRVGTAYLVDSKVVAQLTRRSTRGSPMRDLLDDEAYLQVRGKLGDVGETFPKGKSGKQAGSRFVRKGALRSSLPISEGERVFGGEKSQKVVQRREALRRSRRNASAGNESKQEVSSGDEAKNVKRKKMQKKHGERDLKEESETSISNSKTGAGSKASEVPKKSVGPQTSHSASKQGKSHILSVGLTACDEVISVEERGTNVQFSALGIRNVCSRNSPQKSLQNISTEIESVGRDCSPYPAMGLFEDNPEEANVEAMRSGEQINRIKQPTQMQEREDDREMTSNFVIEDLNNAGGDKDEASELHEVVNISENVTFLSSGPDLSADSSIALDVVGARSELNDTVDKDVSKVKHSAVPAKSHEIGESNLLEGANCIKQSSQVQEWNDDKSMTSDVNHETKDHDIIGGNGVSMSHDVMNVSENVLSSYPCSAAPTVDFSIATDGAEIEVTDVNEGNIFELQRSSHTIELREIVGCSETKQPSKKLEEYDPLVTSSGNLDLKDQNVIGSDQAGLAETTINNVGIEVDDVNGKKFSEVRQSQVCIYLQELENDTLVEGAHEASSMDPRMDSLSCDFPICSDKNLDFTSLIEDSNTGEVSTLPAVSHNQLEGFEASPDVEHAKLPAEAPTGCNDSQLLETGMEEVRGTCQSPTLTLAKNDSEKAEAEVPLSSPSKHPAFAQCSGEEVKDHGISQAGLDYASVRVSIENHTSSKKAQLFGPDAAEVKFETCTTPTLSFSEDDDGVGTDGNRNAGEMAESGLNAVDMRSAAYSVMMEGSGAFTDAVSYEDDNKLIETKNVPGLPSSDNCDPEVVSEFLSSANKIISHSTGSDRVIISDHSEASDIPLRSADDKEVINDSSSPACVPGDKQVRMHFSDQQRDLLSLSCNAASLDINPDSSSAEYKVLRQLTAEPVNEHVDVKLDINIGLADSVVEEMESIMPLKGETNDLCEDFSAQEEHDSSVADKFDGVVSEQGDASVLQAPHAISGEPQATDFSTHETFETADCQASEKSLKDDTSTEDAIGLMNDNDISVDKFDKIQEQDDASVLTPFRMVAFETAEAASSIPFETPAYQACKGKTECSIAPRSKDRDPANCKVEQEKTSLLSTSMICSAAMAETETAMAETELIARYRSDTSMSDMAQYEMIIGILDDGKALDGGEDADYADNCKDVEQGETAVCSSSVVASSALEEAEFHLHHKVNISVHDMAQVDRVTGILEYEKVPSSCGQSLASPQEQRRENIEEGSAKEVKKVSPEKISADIKEVSAIDDEKTPPTLGPSVVGRKDQSSTDIKEVSASVTNDQLDKTLPVKENTTVLVGRSNYSTDEDVSSAHGGYFGGEFDRLQQTPLVSRSLQPDAEEAYVASSRPLMYLEEFFSTDTDVANIVNDSGQVAQWEERTENLHFSKCLNYLEVNSMKEPGERDKMEDMCFPRSFGAESEEAFFLGSGAFTDHENISASSPIATSSPIQEEKNLGQGASALRKDEG